MAAHQFGRQIHRGFHEFNLFVFWLPVKIRARSPIVWTGREACRNIPAPPVVVEEGKGRDFTQNMDHCVDSAPALSTFRSGALDALPE